MGTRPSQDTLHFKSFSMSSLGSISTFSSISTWLVALLAQKLCPVPKSPDYKNSKSLPKPSKNITRAQPSTPQTTNLITQKDNHKSKKKLLNLHRSATVRPFPLGLGDLTVPRAASGSPGFTRRPGSQRNDPSEAMPSALRGRVLRAARRPVPLGRPRVLAKSRASRRCSMTS